MNTNEIRIGTVVKIREDIRTMNRIGGDPAGHIADFTGEVVKVTWGESCSDWFLPEHLIAV